MLRWLGDAVGDAVSGLAEGFSLVQPEDERPGLSEICLQFAGHRGPLTTSAETLAFDPVQRLLAVCVDILCNSWSHVSKPIIKFSAGMSEDFQSPDRWLVFAAANNERAENRLLRSTPLLRKWRKCLCLAIYPRLRGGIYLKGFWEHSYKFL